MSASFTIDERQWDELVQMLGAVDAKKVAGRAVRDVAKTARSRVVKSIAREFTAKQKDLRKETAIRKAGPVASKVVLTGRRPSLMAFRGRPKVPRSEMARTKSGKLRKSLFRYEIERGDKKTARNVFVQRVKKAGNKALPLMRRGKARYPVDVPRGPSVPGIWQADRQNNVRKDVIGDLRPQLAKRVRGQVHRLLQQQTRSAQRSTARLLGA